MIPVVCLSGEFDMISMESVQRDGFTGILVQPFTPRDLSQLIIEVLKKPILMSTGPSWSTEPSWGGTNKSGELPNISPANESFLESDKAAVV